MKNKFRREYLKMFLLLLVVLFSTLAYSKQFSFVHHGMSSLYLVEEDIVDGAITTTKFKDINNKLTYASDKGYAYIQKIHNNDGQIIEEYYFDENGMPVRQSEGQYGLEKVYNKNGQNYLVTFLDSTGNPMLNTSGYATEVRTFNGKNQIIQELYYGLDGNPIQLSSGQYGVIYEYNEDGNSEKVTFIDQNGKASRLNSGITSLFRTFNNDGSINTEYYLGMDGNPIQVYGAYGIKHLGNYRFFVDQNGRILISLNNIVQNLPWFIVLSGIILSLIVVFIPQRLKKVFLITYLAFILSQTIFFRESGNKLELTPFWSYKHFFSNYSLRLEILNNIWLFVPLGASLYSLLHKCQSFEADKVSKELNKNNIGIEKETVRFSTIIILTAMIFSIIIEVSQYFFALGLCELDDVISNTLGSAIGVVMAVCLLEIKGSMYRRKIVKASATDPNQVIQ